MKKFLLIVLSALLFAFMVGGCGLVSGTVLVTQEIDGEIVTDTQPGTARGRGSLDVEIGSALVDLTDNEDYGNIDVDGIDAGCVRTHAVNHLATPISGEVWITDADFDSTTSDPAVIRANGYRVFHGIALLPNEERDFTCEETLGLIENLDLFTASVQVGRFRAWGLGDQTIYCFTLSNIYIGLYLVGSL